MYAGLLRTLPIAKSGDAYFNERSARMDKLAHPPKV